MSEINVKEQLRYLVELQKDDGEIFSLKKELQEKPLEIEVLKAGFESKKARLAQLEEDAKQVQLKRKEMELEMNTKEDEIAKANAQLSQIKTNKEYTAKITEIENIKADKSMVEEKILLSYDEVEEINGEITKEKDVVTQEEKKYLDAKQEIESYIRGIEQKIKELEDKRSQIAPKVDSNLLARYEKILNHKDGLAVVPILGQACGGCFMNLQPQTLNVIRMGEDLTECQICSRILYAEENL